MQELSAVSIFRDDKEEKEPDRPGDDCILGDPEVPRTSKNPKQTHPKRSQGNSNDGQIISANEQISLRDNQKSINSKYHSNKKLRDNARDDAMILDHLQPLMEGLSTASFKKAQSLSPTVKHASNATCLLQSGMHGV